MQFLISTIIMPRPLTDFSCGTVVGWPPERNSYPQGQNRNSFRVTTSGQSATSTRCRYIQVISACDSEQLEQSFHGQTCFGQNLSKRARADSFVVRHNDACVRIRAPENNMAPSLAVHDETDSQQSFHQILA